MSSCPAHWKKKTINFCQLFKWSDLQVCFCLFVYLFFTTIFAHVTRQEQQKSFSFQSVKVISIYNQSCEGCLQLVPWWNTSTIHSMDLWKCVLLFFFPERNREKRGPFLITSVMGLPQPHGTSACICTLCWTERGYFF